jgi:3-hexulose-6-phosphate synthase
MELQVALDRRALDDAVRIATQVAPHAHRLEVGTSLIKEFGVSSIRRLRRAVPERHLVADVKTFDNAHYEFELCFNAGADAATVLGAAPEATVRTCADVARAHRRQVLIDLLATSSRRQANPLVHHDAIFGTHIGKDGQEAQPERRPIASMLPDWTVHRRVALAGGIRLDDLATLVSRDHS